MSPWSTDEAVNSVAAAVLPMKKNAGRHQEATEVLCIHQEAIKPVENRLQMAKKPLVL